LDKDCGSTRTSVALGLARECKQLLEVSMTEKLQNSTKNLNFQGYNHSVALMTTQLEEWRADHHFTMTERARA
jgi:hypothetical protein